MSTLRCTKKLQQYLGVGVKPEPEEVEPTSVLGAWYGNLVFMPKSWLLDPTQQRAYPALGAYAARRRRAGRVQAAGHRLLRRLEIPKEAVAPLGSCEREVASLLKIGEKTAYIMAQSGPSLATSMWMKRVPRGEEMATMCNRAELGTQ